MSLLFPFATVVLLILTLLSPIAPKQLTTPTLVTIGLTVILTVQGLIQLDKQILPRLSKQALILFTIIGLYICSQLISGIIGLINSKDAWTTARSLGPYIIFLPLVLFSIKKNHSDNGQSMKIILSALTGCGLLQSIYTIYFYLSTSLMHFDLGHVLLNRITAFDLRITLPFFSCQRHIANYQFL
jgi:hypothetical protein